MNETLRIFFDFSKGKPENPARFLKRLDSLLLSAGWAYSGQENCYIPLEPEKRDRTAFLASKMVKSAPWLSPYGPVVATGDLTSACTLEEIVIDAMARPYGAKIYRYENYFQRTKKLAHAIVVDERNRLRTGYVSYLLAKKYGLTPEILCSFSAEPLKKLVYGTHVTLLNGRCRQTGKKLYAWLYDKKPAVIPGDVLLADTKKGPAYILVRKIDYVTGSRQCRSYKKILAHTGISVTMASESPNNGAMAA